MLAFFQEIFILLTTSPGNLAYHLVLAFTIAGALQATLASFRRTGFYHARRTIAGLLILLILRLALFAVAALAGQNLIPPHILPPLDRGVALFSLIMIIWMWAFPEPVRMADAANWLIGLLVITFTALSLIWWTGQPVGTTYNGTWAESAAEGLSLVILFLGGLILILRRPTGWGFGISMLGLLFLGHLFEYLIPMPGSDFPGVVRLAQMAAYPLLLTLPNRFVAPAHTLAQSRVDEIQRSFTQSDLLQAVLSLGTERQPEKICYRITSEVADLMNADLVLLITIPNGPGPMVINCGYDHEQGVAHQAISFAETAAPTLVKKLRKKQVAHMLASTTGIEMTELSHALGYPQLGPLLAVPIGEIGALNYNLVLMSPASNREWTSSDEASLSQIAAALTGFIYSAQRVDDLEVELEQVRDRFQTTQNNSANLRSENEKLREQVAEAQTELEQAQQRAESLAALIRDQKEEFTEQEFSSGETGKEAGQQAANARVNLLKASASADEMSYLEGELRLALEEVANLKALLSEADQKLLQLEEQASVQTKAARDAQQVADEATEQAKAQTEELAAAQAALQTAQQAAQEAGEQAAARAAELEAAQTALKEAQEAATAAQAAGTEQISQEQSSSDLSEGELALSPEQTETIASISQELRQPMSSIVGYTDLLLGESVGILGALQKKFLERIKASTERMSSLVEDLIQMTVVSSGRSELDAERVDLAPIIDEAMSLTMNQLREKNITLRVDLPDKLPQVGADRDAVQQILLHLLKNAGGATPVEGEIALRVSVQEQNKQADYVLLQVADTGGGIPPEELPRVFSRLYRSDNALIQGVGDNGIGLSIVKSLVEAVGGRIWVDTEMEVGSTFSVLLPVANHHGGQEGQPG